MSLTGALDAIAAKAKTGMSNIKNAYAVGTDDGVSPIPRGIEDTPVAMVRLGSGDMQGGNHEHVVFGVTLEVWAAADNAGWAHKTLTGCIDQARTTFRADMDLGGDVSRCQMLGWDGFDSQTIGERTYLILPIRLEVLITRYASDASA
jgi:hypothetical protein